MVSGTLARAWTPSGPPERSKPVRSSVPSGRVVTRPVPAHTCTSRYTRAMAICRQTRIRPYWPRAGEEHAPATRAAAKAEIGTLHVALDATNLRAEVARVLEAFDESKVAHVDLIGDSDPHNRIRPGCDFQRACPHPTGGSGWCWDRVRLGFVITWVAEDATSLSPSPHSCASSIGGNVIWCQPCAASGMT